MRARLLVPVLMVGGSVLIPPGVLAVQNPICPSGGIQYQEWPERGPAVKGGRPLAGSLGTDYGVDINSRIEIKVDTLCLQTFLDTRSGSRSRSRASVTLRARLGSLSEIVRSIPLAIHQLENTFAVYQDTSGRSDSLFRERLRTSSTTIRRTLVGLRGAIQSRLEETGLSKTTAEVTAGDEVAAAFAGPEKMGYDWEVIGRLLDREIQLAQSTLEVEHAAQPYAVELRAHLVTAKGQFPIPVAGYNDEAPCLPTRIEPIQLELSSEQAAVYQEAESLEKQLGVVRGIGDVVVTSVLRDIDRIRPALESLVTRAERATVPAAAAARSLLRWKDPEALRRWVQGLGNELGQDPKGAALRTTLDSLSTVAQGVDAGLNALRSLGALRQDLEGATARNAMVTILANVSPVLMLKEGSAAALTVLLPDTWNDHAGLAARALTLAGELRPQLRERVRNDARGPVADIRAARTALTEAARSLQDVSRDAIELVGRVLGLPPALVAADLPEPVGLKRRTVGGGLETNIRLTDICTTRQENDEVRVEYRFFAGEQLIASRSDRFHLRLYGWRSRVSAGLAFALRKNTETWRPGAAVSWIFTRSGWPTGDNLGMGDPTGLRRVGFGLTTVNLHFESDESIELGIGPSLSFLNDRIIIGGGWNLQAHGDHLYALLSVRLLDVDRNSH